MNIECPYCYKKLDSWIKVRKHTSTCKDNSHEYCISEEYGPIHYSEFTSKILLKYPKLTKVADKRKNFKKYGLVVGQIAYRWNRETIKEAILLFHSLYKRIPQARDFENNSNPSFPGRTKVIDTFGTWNDAIKFSGFEPNYNDGFGERIVGLDGILYRSNAEAIFSDKFLFNKEEYIYELKYENHNKYYDFYLPKRDLYIEIDGGCRPEIIKDKILINELENKQLLVIEYKNFNTFSWPCTQ